MTNATWELFVVFNNIEATEQKLIFLEESTKAFFAKAIQSAKPQSINYLTKENLLKQKQRDIFLPITYIVIDNLKQLLEITV